MIKTRLALVILCCSFLFSCGGSESSGEVKIDGSSTVYPLTEAVAEEFRNEKPAIRVTVGSSGTGAGFTKFIRGETDISDASRPISEREKKAARENGISFIEFTVALDGISIVVNPKNDWIDTITPEELKKIWEPDTQVQQWSDLRGDWPQKDIHLFGPNTAHGTYDFFTQTIMGKSGASRSDYNAVSDYNVAVQGISTDKYAMGYFGLAYYEENQDKLKLIGVDTGDGAVNPSVKTVKNGSYKPLSRPLYIYVAQSSVRRPAVQSFVNFYLNKAVSLAKAVGYVPLPADDYKQQRSAFHEFATDTSTSQP